MESQRTGKVTRLTLLGLFFFFFNLLEENWGTEKLLPIASISVVL